MLMRQIADELLVGRANAGKATQTSCAACDAQIAKVGAQNVGVYVANGGAMYPHLLCNRARA
jgi:hypothetical protein